MGINTEEKIEELEEQQQQQNKNQVFEIQKQNQIQIIDQYTIANQNIQQEIEKLQNILAKIKIKPDKSDRPTLKFTMCSKTLEAVIQCSGKPEQDGSCNQLIYNADVSVSAKTFKANIKKYEQIKLGKNKSIFKNLFKSAFSSAGKLFLGTPEYDPKLKFKYDRHSVYTNIQEIEQYCELANKYDKLTSQLKNLQTMYDNNANISTSRRSGKEGVMTLTTENIKLTQQEVFQIQKSGKRRNKKPVQLNKTTEIYPTINYEYQKPQPTEKQKKMIKVIDELKEYKQKLQQELKKLQKQQSEQKAIANEIRHREAMKKQTVELDNKIEQQTKKLNKIKQEKNETIGHYKKKATEALNKKFEKLRQEREKFNNYKDYKKKQLKDKSERLNYKADKINQKGQQLGFKQQAFNQFKNEIYDDIEYERNLLNNHYSKPYADQQVERRKQQRAREQSDYNARNNIQYDEESYNEDESANDSDFQ
jgi:hypothetical protein